MNEVGIVYQLCNAPNMCLIGNVDIIKPMGMNRTLPDVVSCEEFRGGERVEFHKMRGYAGMRILDILFIDSRG